MMDKITFSAAHKKLFYEFCTKKSYISKFYRMKNSKCYKYRKNEHYKYNCRSSKTSEKHSAC